MDEPWLAITRSGRRLDELQREDLETLVLEMCDEYDLRNIKTLKLKIAIDQLQTQVEYSEENSRCVALGYVTPPEQLISKPKINSRQSPRSSQSKPNDNGQPVYGSFNSYQAGNKRVVTLRHKLQNVNDRITNVKNERQKLIELSETLKRRLEERVTPALEPFHHTYATPKKKNPNHNPTFNKVVKSLERMIPNEKDDEMHDLLSCVYCLMTGNDVVALQTFSDLSMPTVSRIGLEDLQDKLNDRNAQLSILYERYKNFQNDNSKLIDDYQSLNEKMRDHVIDDEYQKQNLLDQLKQIEEELQKIPLVQEQITAKTTERENLYDEIEKLHQDGKKTIDYEVEMKTKIQEIQSQTLTEQYTEKQLHSENDVLKSEENEIRMKKKNAEEDLPELVTRKNEIQAQKQYIDDKLNMLKIVQIDDPGKLSWVYEFSNSSTVEDIIEYGKNIEEKKKRNEQTLSDLKSEIKKTKEENLQLQRRIKKLGLKKRDKKHKTVPEEKTDDENSKSVTVSETTKTFESSSFKEEKKPQNTEESKPLVKEKSESSIKEEEKPPIKERSDSSDLSLFESSISEEQKEETHEETKLEEKKEETKLEEKKEETKPEEI